jgi:pimeloyl-ACP methyl ester carboxylesterase
MPDPAFLWLHGFASSPASGKGRFAQARLAERGLPLAIPDLNEPSFRELTVGRMLAQVDALAAAAGGRLVLFGSSLGGYTAATWAALHPDRCAALVLLAPAFALHRRWCERMGPGPLAEWRERGTFEFDHWARGRKEPLSIRFLEEAAGREEFPLPLAPTLILQGRRDEVVDPALAREFQHRMRAAGRDARLVELDDGHELSSDLPGLWREIEPFLEPALAASAGG